MTDLDKAQRARELAEEARQLVDAAKADGQTEVALSLAEIATTLHQLALTFVTDSLRDDDDDGYYDDITRDLAGLGGEEWLAADMPSTSIH